MVPATAQRQTAEERREAVLEAALAEFAVGGLRGTSTEDIAARAGISQPYLFRLFGTKKKLFLAVVERCFARILEAFEEAARTAPDDVLAAIGRAYMETLDRDMLLAQMHAYAACDDPDVRRTVRRGFGRLVEYVERVSQADRREVARFFASGMLFNVAAAMDLFHANEPWGLRLVEGCKGSG